MINTEKEITKKNFSGVKGPKMVSTVILSGITANLCDSLLEADLRSPGMVKSRFK